MLYRISVAERGLTGIANIFRSRLSGLDDLLRAGTVPLIGICQKPCFISKHDRNLDFPKILTDKVATRVT